MVKKGRLFQPARCPTSRTRREVRKRSKEMNCREALPVRKYCIRPSPVGGRSRPHQYWVPGAEAGAALAGRADPG